MQRFKLESFSFVGDHPFVYMHCKVKICNATDTNSRCAQGCLHERRKRSLYSQESNDEEYNLAQGPFMLKEDDVNEANLQETVEGLRSLDIKGNLWQNLQRSAQVICIFLYILLASSNWLWLELKRQSYKLTSTARKMILLEFKSGKRTYKHGFDQVWGEDGCILASRSINSHNKNEVNIKPSWPKKLGQ